MWDSQPGSGWAVYRQAPSGVSAFSATGTTGVNTGVRCQTSSRDGFAGFFHNAGNETGPLNDGVCLRVLAGERSPPSSTRGRFYAAADEFSAPCAVRRQIFVVRPR